MSHDIYDIIRRLDESLNPQQKSVPQLPALFQPKPITVLGAKTDPQHPMKGYAVGTSESAQDAGSDETNPMRQAVLRRIVNQHPEWITRYGPEFLLQVIDDVTEGDTEWEEIGSSDVSAYVNMVHDRLRDHAGSREEIDEIEMPQTNTTQQPVSTQTGVDTDMAAKRLATGTGQSGNVGVLGKAVDAAVAGKTLDPAQKQVIGKTMGAVQQAAAQDTRLQQLLKNATGGLAEDVGAATEDVLSTVKKKLGDYLQDVATAIQKDPDLKDKIPQDIDQVKAVKTITTDDGHEIKIHGNEDDGFRISIKNREIKKPFKSLDEATMACEMYCARRRMAEMAADYVEEKR